MYNIKKIKYLLYLYFNMDPIIETNYKINENNDYMDISDFLQDAVELLTYDLVPFKGSCSKCSCASCRSCGGGCYGCKGACGCKSCKKETLDEMIINDSMINESILEKIKILK